MSNPKTITRQQYLTGLALFTLAASHNRKLMELEKEMNNVLGFEESSRLSDELYCEGTFDRGLEIMGVTVEE